MDDVEQTPSEQVEQTVYTECVECGRPFTVLTPPALAEKGLCSYRCWAWLYGEVEYD